MKRPLSVVCLTYIVLVLLMMKVSTRHSVDYSSENGKTIQFVGQVIKKEIKNESLVITCQKINLSDSGQNSNQKQLETKLNKEKVRGVMCYFNLEDDFIEPKMGAYIQVQGTLNEFQTSTNPGSFDLDGYYAAQKTDFRVYDPKIIARSETYNRYKEKLYLLKKRAERVLDATFSSVESSIMKAMLLGNKSEMDLEVKNIFQESGISHMLAISGLHISIMGGVIYKLLRRMRVNLAVSSIISILLIISYGFLTGMSVSAFRAILMFSLKIIADVLERTYDLVTAVSLALFLVVLQNPESLTLAGTQLSFAAVIGATILNPVLKEFRYKFLQGPITILLATFPLVCRHYYSYPVYSIVWNILVVPFMGVLMLMGLLVILVGIFSLPVASLIAKIPYIILLFYENGSKFVAKLPGNHWVVGRPDWYKIIIYYVALLLLAYSYKNISKKLIIIWMMVTFCLVAKQNYSEMEITMLDVGQGDGIVFIDPLGECVTIDGGSSSMRALGQYTLVPFLEYNGVNCISYAFITHLDSDHYSAIQEILENPEWGIRIKTLVVSQAMKREPFYEELERLCKQNKTELVTMHQGDWFSSGNLKMRCLWPQKNQVLDDINEGSLVLDVEYKNFRGLFTGDIGETSERELNHILEEKTYNVLKAAHHGSKYSNSEAFLEKINPNEIWISAGKDNSYGHPHQESLERMQKTGAEIHVTIEEGAIIKKIP